MLFRSLVRQGDWLLGLRLGSSLAGFAFYLRFSILGRPVSLPALPPVGHPGILEYVHVDDTPIWYIPDISPRKVLSSPAVGFFDGPEVVSPLCLVLIIGRCRT